MNKEWLSHIIAGGAFAVFIVLGLACMSVQSSRGGYAVYFDANGGSGAVPRELRAGSDSGITLPGGGGLSFGNATFGGWILYEGNTATVLEAGSTFAPTDNIVLYAKWELDAVDFNSATGLANKLVWLQNNAESNSSYTIEVNSNERIGAQDLNYRSKNNITVTLAGIGANRTVSLSSDRGNLFRVFPGVTLVLDNITLQGHGNNTTALVVCDGGTIRINAGTTVTGNTGTAYAGNGIEGVYVLNKGTVIMDGGTISGNSGEGVGVLDGTFTMNNGTISGNGSTGVVVRRDGTSNGTFTMNGGIISGHTITGSGGGVNVFSGEFIMIGGEISGNQVRGNDPRNFSYGYGGGVFVNSLGRFTMRGGTISGNAASFDGNGVYLLPPAILNITGGTVQPSK